ncbi:MAG TPA: hypothetical protein VFH63_05625 [candidate division Zixibacteria bacterium]|nr:hypothetical protein [candidate division Zixibacteria bacterium]
MSGRTRLVVLGLALLALVTGAVLLAFAASSCPVDLPNQPCPEAGFNRAVVVGLAAATAGLLVAPFAFLAEFAARRRIVYRGAWGRAARRGLLAAAVVAALAGLRIGDALTVPVALFVVVLAGMVEWFAVRRFDLP